ncbi:hypothetical protein CPT03_08435 [Pedobacter ginsengisoli]|uniref:Uncharacterized protein n=1 Tax=Pedobacter ginsengisoli TaxID=363852 RepID=A0A2D1U4I9_9SPHI|nr:hypothetical protein [Pedobacter ginsengisoli]ATP56498.1 hypothetical protein CPT03_08435 [Pedobacter ginsengisoli]
MKFFRKTKREKGQITLTGHLAAYLENWQRSLADRLNEKIRKLSGKALLYLLILFCVLVGSYLLYIILRAFN